MVGAAGPLGVARAPARGRVERDPDPRRARQRPDDPDEGDRPVHPPRPLEARAEIEDLGDRAVGVGQPGRQDRRVLEIALLGRTWFSSAIRHSPRGSSLFPLSARAASRTADRRRPAARSPRRSRPRGRSARSPGNCRSARATGQPSPPPPASGRHSGDVAQPPARRGRPRRADQHARPAQRGGRLERMLVGQIVAHEHRTRAGEGWFRHQPPQRAPLSAPCGRSSATILPRWRARPLRSARSSTRRPPRPRLALGREPVMERDSGGLVLDQQARRPGGEAADLLARAGETRRRRNRNPPAVGVKQLGSVRARKHCRRATEMAPQIVDGPAADDGEAALEPSGKPVEKRLQALRNRDRRACRPARPECRRNRGKARPDRVGTKAAAGIRT
jgi:hypothetical protein